MHKVAINTECVQPILSPCSSEISEIYLNKTGIESRPRPSFTLKEAMESKAPKRQIKTVSLN